MVEPVLFAGSLAELRGATPPVIARLRKLGIFSVHDLLLHLPLRYLDETRITPVDALHHGSWAVVEGEIIAAENYQAHRNTLLCQLRDAVGGTLLLRFLHVYPGQVTRFRVGTRMRVSGEARAGLAGVEMVHPHCRQVEEGAALRTALTPVYPTTAGLSQATLRRLVDNALQQADLAEALPVRIYGKHVLPLLVDSLGFLHRPPPGMADGDFQRCVARARQRLAFDELLAQQFSMRRYRIRRRAREAHPMVAHRRLTVTLLQSLPFELTAAQVRAWEEISDDMAQPYPMQRLLQGDVGSGKTIVSALAALQAVENGWQAAFMAPTEILAEQHYRKLCHWLTPLGVCLAWMTGAQSRGVRERTRAALAEGTTQIIVGTHALFQEQVQFARLGLAVVDEQHRFGVHQRLALRQKGMQTHQLMMSATPIPRTLAMSYYADLDVSVIDESPPGRQPVVTKLISENRREEVLARLKEVCGQGRQAYWVCPLIEESSTLQLQTALDTHARLTAALPELVVGLVHGRMKASEKHAVMQDFLAGKVHVLVATTVIEVGVDVPNASLMVIEHAERMGLSQLHQLRGRVGRGADLSTCILLYQHPLSEQARSRLKIIYETTDGFKIAQADLELRGPGEFLGVRQSGAPWLKVADLERDAILLPEVQKVADELLRDEPQSVDAHLRRWWSQAEVCANV